MRNRAIPIFICVVAIVGALLTVVVFEQTQVGRYRAARSVANQRSEVRLSLEIRYDAGAIAEEAYRMADLDGVSHATYRILSRDGTQITIEERARPTLDPDSNVAYLFQRLVQDGIWELRTKPPRGDVRTHYAVAIAQVAGDAHGSRLVRFTDPHYWATTGGHQFHITLSRDKPVPDLLRMTSTTLVEPRYEKLIADFRAFGSTGFRAKIVAARERIAGRA